jgi:hypothetical protein
MSLVDAELGASPLYVRSKRVVCSSFRRTASSAAASALAPTWPTRSAAYWFWSMSEKATLMEATS